MNCGLVFVLLVVFSSLFTNAATPGERAKLLVSNMTTAEKIHMVHGVLSFPLYAGHIAAVSRLSIPALNLQDGPQGVGDGATKVTNWPSALTVAATWDTALMQAFGVGTAAEERAKGANIHLSPIVNILRVPWWGRSYECMGEDPYLSAQMGVACINGIQSQGVIANVKHWVNYNQETDRTTVSANVDERTEWEIYYPAFQAAVNAGVASVMCSYNKINNTHACENDDTINRDLKGRMGFQGFVVSDWFATHSSAKSANHGLDMEMPIGLYFDVQLSIDVSLGTVPLSRLNDMATRIFTALYGGGIFDNPQTGDLDANVTSWSHTLLARQIAAAATVLLKNDGNLLPLNATSLKKIAVIGDDAKDVMVYEGSGSGKVKAPYVITPFDAIKSRAGSSVGVTYASSSSIPAAVALAQASDVAIVFAGVEAGEEKDRPNLSLTGNADALIAAVAAANPKTVVVLHVPGASLMPWLGSVKSVLNAFYPGQENGNAIAEVLFGDVNPSAKLPLSYPTSETTSPINSAIQYPGVNGQTNYTEQLLVGYRWHDAKGVAPLFPFGHGLSYTTFTYSDLSVVPNGNGIYQVTFFVKNTGSVYGSEVTQLYVSFPLGAGEPPQGLRGFKKVPLGAGEATSVQFSLSAPDFSFWDITSHSYKVYPGTFQIHVGSSSRDIRLAAPLAVKTY